jgi:hypothetical protein
MPTIGKLRGVEIFRLEYFETDAIAVFFPAIGFFMVLGISFRLTVSEEREPAFDL